ncbi:MAG: cyclic nucleotide-binding domain-containing protein [Magnetococcales bacterium]|nr:cyclic nucleotide-binding domain-containing protein [Magnetococcales bacterium]
MLVLKLIETIPFFRGFTPTERALFAEGDGFFVTYQKGHRLIQEGGTDDDLFIVIKGSVAVTQESAPESILAILEAGTVIGEMSFLTKHPRASNVTTCEETIVFRIDGSEMQALDIGLQLKIKDQLIAILVDRVTHVNADLARQKLSNQALAAALAKLGDRLRG